MDFCGARSQFLTGLGTTVRTIDFNPSEFISRGQSHPLKHNQRVHFMHNVPASSSSTSGKFIHGSHWPVVSGWPAILKDSRIMEQHEASGHHEAAPVRPILMDRGFFVVSVNKKQINWFRPEIGRAS